MNWFGSGQMVKVAGKVTENTVTATAQTGNGAPESERAIEVAKSVALSVVESDVFAADAVVSVTLSGHSNNDHEDQPGYANDYFSVSLSQQSKPVATEASEAPTTS